MFFIHLFLVILLCVSTFGSTTERPQQIHLSFGADATQMLVTWVTMNTSPEPVVEYGISGLNNSVIAKTTLFVDEGYEKRNIYIHRAVLKDLKTGSKYQYRCGNQGIWSAVYSFRTKKSGTDWSPRLAIYGDMGYVNSQSLSYIREDVKRGLYDTVLHVGDIAYDMDSDNGRVGDEFMRDIEPIAAQVPYQVCPGNHEHRYNFSNYDNQFSMIDTRSGQMNNHFYSFNIGSAHIISFSTEFYYYTQFGWDQIRNQFHWLEDTLREANTPANRAHRPWIITMAHKPLYCMTNDKLCTAIDETAFQRHRLRKGIQMRHNGPLKFGLEHLLHKYGVDIQLYGHEHNYQRLFPVYDNHVYNGTTHNPYHNPTEPIVIITGSAGCHENHSKFRNNIPVWSAFRNSDYGYTRMTIHNKTHISIEQVSDDQGGKVVDKFQIIKDRKFRNV